MDLHDYRDVAENYDLYLDAMNAGGDNYDGFQEFYLEMARTCGGGGVIDIACGTGAVLLYLAEHGIFGEGTDLSEAMCAVTREKAAALGFSLPVFQGNMTDFACSRSYSLAIIARSGFMHLLRPEDQRRALLHIREHLTDGGILSLNTFQPHPIMQAQQMQSSEEDYRFRLEYRNRDGRREKIYNAMTYDPYTQIMSGNWKFETLDEDGRVIAERIRPVRMRQTYRQEMAYLAELCGYEIAEVFADFHGHPAEEHPSSPELARHLVWVLRKKG